MNETRRIRPPARFDDLIDKLVFQKDSPFETKQALMMFAAAIGYSIVGKREPIEKAGEGIDWGIFERRQDTSFIYALALADKESIAILGQENQDEDDLITIFEEYAAAGLQYIKQHCVDVPGNALDNLLSFLADARMRHSDPPPGLDGLTTAELELLGGI